MSTHYFLNSCIICTFNDSNTVINDFVPLNFLLSIRSFSTSSLLVVMKSPPVSAVICMLQSGHNKLIHTKKLCKTLSNFRRLNNI